MSTSGVWSTQFPLANLPDAPGVDREVWLWDFGGQADQRLIHQLYLDNTAVVVLMFGGHEEAVLPGLRQWRQALAKTSAGGARTLLVAGRTDVDFRFDRERVRSWAAEQHLRYLETSAERGDGLDEFKAALLDSIPWDELTPHSSTARFMRLKAAVITLRDEGRTLLTATELAAVLHERLPAETLAEGELDTIVTQLDGPGVVKRLDFGDYILLRPEWINRYAQALIRTLRHAEPPLGSLPVSAIAAGDLRFQWCTEDGREGEQQRLPSDEEGIVLLAMERSLIARRICLRQDGDLVFPSYCGRERPELPATPEPFVSYQVRGFLDDIYASLVVKLAHCGAYELRDLWRDVAEFQTVAGRHRLGVRLQRSEDGRGELTAWHGHGLATDAQVLLGNYIHRHLDGVCTEPTQRQRHYRCGACGHPVKDLELVREFIETDKKAAQIHCQKCRREVPLWDEMEELCADEHTREIVQAMDRAEQANLTATLQGQLLVYEVQQRLTSAGLVCHVVDGTLDDGIDLLVQVNRDDGTDSGKRMHLQVKCGESYLRVRKRDRAEVFRIKKQAWVKKWVRQEGGPVMLVVGSLAVDDRTGLDREKRAFKQVRWMRVDECLRRELDAGRERITQIVFQGEPMDLRSITQWRAKLLPPKE